MVSRRQFLTIGAGGLVSAGLGSRAIAQTPSGAAPCRYGRGTRRTSTTSSPTPTRRTW
jgi:hypothetical protein